MANVGLFPGIGKSGSGNKLTGWHPRMYQGATEVLVDWKSSYAFWGRTELGLIFVDARVVALGSGAATTVEITLPVRAATANAVGGSFLAAINGSGYQGLWQADVSGVLGQSTDVIKFWAESIGTVIPGANAMAAGDYVAFSGFYRPVS